jgi:hypothetical protein
VRIRFAVTSADVALRPVLSVQTQWMEQLAVMPAGAFVSLTAVVAVVGDVRVSPAPSLDSTDHK